MRSSGRWRPEKGPHLPSPPGRTRVMNAMVWKIPSGWAGSSYHAIIIGRGGGVLIGCVQQLSDGGPGPAAPFLLQLTWQVPILLLRPQVQAQNWVRVLQGTWIRFQDLDLQDWSPFLILKTQSFTWHALPLPLPQVEKPTMACSHRTNDSECLPHGIGPPKALSALEKKDHNSKQNMIYTSDLKAQEVKMIIKFTEVTSLFLSCQPVKYEQVSDYAFKCIKQVWRTGKNSHFMSPSKKKSQVVKLWLRKILSMFHRWNGLKG